MRRGRLKGPQGPDGPWVLGFESGGDHLSVALWRLGSDPGAPTSAWRLVGERIQHRGHQHADAVLLLTDELLSLAGIAPKDLSLVVSGRGPGGFTGVRVGLATAIGLAVGAGCAVWPVDSLQVLALNASGVGTGDRIVVPLIDARRNEVYGAAYGLDGSRIASTLLEPRVGAAVSVIEEARSVANGADIMVFGSGAVVYGKVEPLTPALWHIPRASNAALLGASVWNSAGRPAEGPVVDPAYVRPSDAELNHQARRGDQ